MVDSDDSMEQENIYNEYNSKSDHSAIAEQLKF